MDFDVLLHVSQNCVERYHRFSWRKKAIQNSRQQKQAFAAALLGCQAELLNGLEVWFLVLLSWCLFFYRGVKRRHI
jgi:hypothetical protein